MKTLEETLEELKAAGLNPQAPKWVSGGNIDLAQIKTVTRQREIMQNLHDILSTTLASDLDQLEKARETLAKMRRGGGV